MAVEVVASLQIVGSDVVASLQFPVDVAARLVDGGGFSTRRRYRPSRDEPADAVPAPVAAVAVAIPPAFVLPPPDFDEEEDEMLLAATVLLLMH